MHATMTFLFTDIEGSTRQWEESPEMHGRVEAHFAALRDAVDDAGGEVFSTMGDGVAAAFTSAERAVGAAIVAQQQLRPTGLAVRMGIHTGEVERVAGDFRGRAVNRAARVMGVGHGGQILLSDVSAAIVRAGGSRMDLLDLGRHRLRDLAEPERVWQAVHPELPSRFPPLRGMDSCATNLPAQRSSLIGRELDIRRVVELVRRHRIVTLTGVGGVGKTRLAVHAAAELAADFANVWYVELAAVGEADDVAAAIARTVGAVAVDDPVGTAAAWFAGQTTLLIVDNCEHLVDSAAAVIDGLTARCRHLSVIATSREALGVEGEHVVMVPSLDPATAVELFRQRADAAGADLATASPSALEELCRRLDGIPLAVELAAARTATLGVGAIAGDLGDRVGLLDGGRRRSVARHTTMRTTIEWSYRLLEADEQRMFRWLSVFPSGFELDAARHVAASIGIAGEAATDHVASLVQKSMLTRGEAPRVPPTRLEGARSEVPVSRYRMLETMRAYALEQLDGTDGRTAALCALAEWVTTLTDLPFADACNATVERSTIRLEREAESWREAVGVAARARSGELAARLCGPPTAFFLLGRHDLADVVRPLLALCDDDDVRQRRAVLCALMVSASAATEVRQLEVWAAEMQHIDDVEPTGLGGLMRWLALAWRGDFAASVDLCVGQSLDPRFAQGTRDLFVGIAVLDHFSLTDATDDRYGLVERALEVADRSDVGISKATCLLGAAWGVAHSEPDRSLQLVRRALDEMPNVPALTRLTLPGSASRLLARLDPRVAAQGLLEQLDATPARRSFVDLIPLFYATALLQRLGHDSAATVLSTLDVSPVAPYLSMMDFVDLARRAAAIDDPVSLRDVETTVRSALTGIVASAEGMAAA